MTSGRDHRHRRLRDGRGLVNAGISDVTRVPVRRVASQTLQRRR
jgi:hypothetical protein